MVGLVSGTSHATGSLGKEIRVLSLTVVHTYQDLTSPSLVAKTHYPYRLQGYDVTTIKLSIYENIVPPSSK
jgi:hypothetical protein